MAAAVYDSVSAEIANGDYTFKSSGSKMKFEGYLKVYNNINDEDEEKMLPPIQEGDKPAQVDLQNEQNFTQPPSRYSEATLVKELEDKDIGRPSTYAPIIATLIERKYITRDKKTLKPTELGFIVTDLMETYFKEIVDVGFTADLEDRLDDIEIKNTEWKEIVGDFYKILEQELEVADNAIEKVTIEDELTDELCEVCGKPMAIKHGRFGEFFGMLRISGMQEHQTNRQQDRRQVPGLR